MRARTKPNTRCKLCGRPTRDGANNCSATCGIELTRRAQLAAFRRAGETPPASLLRPKVTSR